MTEESKIPLIKNTSRIKPVFTLQGRFYYGIDRYELKIEDMSLDSLGSQLNDELGEELLFRGVFGNRLEQVLATGHDIPGIKKGDTTYATSCINQAFLYISSGDMFMRYSGVPNNQLTNDATIMLYSPKLLKAVFPQIEACTMFRFLEDPIDALKGVLLLKPRKKMIKSR